MEGKFRCKTSNKSDIPVFGLFKINLKYKLTKNNKFKNLSWLIESPDIYHWVQV